MFSVPYDISIFKRLYDKQDTKKAKKPAQIMVFNDLRRLYQNQDLFDVQELFRGREAGRDTQQFCRRFKLG